jgi:2,3-dihydroxy-p-cumate/2,3-dihydroxybenzoate 3,4-dioxygenase
VETIDDVFRNWHFLAERDVAIEMGRGRHPQSGAIFLYFLGPEGFTYEYSFGVRRIEDDAAWVPRTFDPAEPGSIDMWLGPTARPITQPRCAPPPPPRPPAPPHDRLALLPCRCGARLATKSFDDRTGKDARR